MQKKKKTINKTLKKADSNLELTVANLALEKSKKFLSALENWLDEENDNGKAALNATIKKEIEKNTQLQKIIKAGKKQASLDNADKTKLKEAIGILKKSENTLAADLKNETLKYRKLRKEMETELETAIENKAILKQKDIEIEQLNKEIMTVAKISSHDLQEPLKNIQLFTSLLIEKERGKLSKQGKEYFQRMQVSAARVRKLMQDLSDYSHLNKVFYKVEKADLNALLQEAKAELHDVILLKNAVINADRLPNLQVVPFHFKKIFKELLCNSLTFTRPKIRPEIEIKCVKVKGSELKALSLNPQKEYYHISFTDNGRGFHMRYKEKIFEVFQRLEINGNTGSGIGLATCKKIIENYDGRITANSEEGKGSVFNIFIAG